VPKLSGIEAAQRIDGVEHALRRSLCPAAFKAEAEGYLLKDSADGDLIEAIKSVHAGETFFSLEITRILMEDYVREIRAPRIAMTC
jgi:two-component system response regulator NreC